MRFGSTAKLLAECKLEYKRSSECPVPLLVRTWSKPITMTAAKLSLLSGTHCIGAHCMLLGRTMGHPHMTFTIASMIATNTLYVVGPQALQGLTCSKMRRWEGPPIG